MFEVYHDEPKNWIINLIFSIINAFLVFYQGVFLSILYCFMNNEVIEYYFGYFRSITNKHKFIISKIGKRCYKKTLVHKNKIIQFKFESKNKTK